MKRNRMVTKISVAIGLGLLVFGALADTPRASAAAPRPTNDCNTEKAQKQNLGSELVVFGGPVRPMVEIQRIPSPLGNGSAVWDGPEFDPKTHTLRPGNMYHMWARITNYGDIDQIRYLSVRKVYESMPTGSLGPDLLKDDEGIATLVREYKTDDDTKNRLGGQPGWGSSKGPIVLSAGESKTFLVGFTLGEKMPEGNWQLSLVLQ